MADNIAPNNENSEIRSCKTLLRIANIAGPVSILIGGVLLGLCGFTCAIVARVKAKRLLNQPGQVGASAKLLVKSSSISIAICALAICLNAIALYLFMPQIIDMVNQMYQGNLSAFETAAQGSTNTSSSTWG